MNFIKTGLWVILFFGSKRLHCEEIPLFVLDADTSNLASLSHISEVLEPTQDNVHHITVDVALELEGKKSYLRKIQWKSKSLHHMIGLTENLLPGALDVDNRSLP